MKPLASILLILGLTLPARAQSGADRVPLTAETLWQIKRLGPPVYDLYTQYAADGGASWNRRYGDFWKDPQRFQANSPHLAAGNFKTPTLVIHGGRDWLKEFTGGGVS